MNITTELYDIITRNHIHLCNNRFENYLTALKLIKQLCTDFPPSSKILIYATCQTDIDFFLNACGIMNWDVTRSLISSSNLECFPQQNDAAYDGVFVVSYHWHLEISYELFLKTQSFIDLYSYFLANNLKLDYDFYRLFEGMYFDPARMIKSQNYKWFDPQQCIFYWLKAYAMEHNKNSKEYYLQNIIFLLLFIKDFVNAEKYINEYCSQQFCDWQSYQRTWKEIQELLKAIKTTLAARNKGDFFVFWLDALPYEDEKSMPFLSSLTNKALVFENIFSVTPYTQSSLKAMLCGKMVLDDQSYRISSITADNSPLLRHLQTRDNHVYYCGIVNKYFSESHLLDYRYTLHSEPPSNIYWLLLSKMMESTSPVFCIAHELFGTHSPYRTFGPDMKRYIHEGSSETNIKKYSRTQCLTSLKQVDSLLQLVSSLLPDNCIKIYMSDHGDFRFASRYHLYHPICKAVGRDIPPQTITSIFSNLDFYKFVDYLLEPEEAKLHALKRNYVEIQDVDYYNGTRLAQLFNSTPPSLESLVGYHGIITDEYLYIRNHLGSEYFEIQNAMDCDTFEKALAFAKTHTRNTKIDVFTDQKFKYSKYIYKVYKNYNRRTNNRHDRITPLIRQLFSEEPCRYAIRGGGISAWQLLLTLTPEQRKNVVCIIDQSDDCIVAKAGYKIIRPEQTANFEIDTIVIPSFQLRETMQKGLNNKNAVIVDLYTYLQSNGIFCDGDFYQSSLVASDYEVGFPFNDFVGEK